MKRTIQRSALVASFAMGLGMFGAEPTWIQAQDSWTTVQGGKVAVQGDELTTMYRETFGFCTDSIGTVAAKESNWWGFVSGLPIAKFSNLKVFAYGSRAIGGSVNSKPLGLSQGYSFWFRPTYGLTVFTQEFSFDASVLRDATTVIEYEQRLSGVNASLEPNRTQLAFLIDSTWYISAESISQNKIASWEQVAFQPANLHWGAVPAVVNRGPTAPALFQDVLPSSGTVNAFGVFLSEVNGRVRIDNFTIKTANPPGGGAQYGVSEPSISNCPETSPDRTGLPPSQPTPNPDENDGTPDQGIPEPRNPGQQPGGSNPNNPDPSGTPSPDGFVFCPLKQQGTGRQIQLTPKILASLLKPIGKTTPEDLRDRAFLSIFSGRKMPMGAVINVLVRDYDAVKGTLSIKKRKNSPAIAIRLKKQARAALDSYLSSLSSVQFSAPLFSKLKAGGREVNPLQAECLTGISAMVKRRAAAARTPLASFLRRG